MKKYTKKEICLARAQCGELTAAKMLAFNTKVDALNAKVTAEKTKMK